MIFNLISGAIANLLVLGDAPPCVIRRPHPCHYGGVLGGTSMQSTLLSAVILAVLLTLSALALRAIVRRRRRGQQAPDGQQR